MTGVEKEPGARVTRVGQERGRIVAGEGAGLIIRPFKFAPFSISWHKLSHSMFPSSRQPGRQPGSQAARQVGMYEDR